jgi:flagellar biogenesis protein FliO
LLNSIVSSLQCRNHDPAPMMSGSMLLAAPALVLVLGLVWLAGRAVRLGWVGHPARRSGETRLSIVQTLPLDQRRRLHLVSCDGRHVLLLTGGTHDAVLDLPTRPPDPV